MKRHVHVYLCDERPLPWGTSAAKPIALRRVFLGPGNVQCIASSMKQASISSPMKICFGQKSLSFFPLAILLRASKLHGSQKLKKSFVWFVVIVVSPVVELSVLIHKIWRLNTQWHSFSSRTPQAAAGPGTFARRPSLTSEKIGPGAWLVQKRLWCYTPED